MAPAAHLPTEPIPILAGRTQLEVRAFGGQVSTSDPDARNRGYTTRCPTASCNELERFFRRLNPFRRIATRYDKLDSVFLAFIDLTLAYDALQLT